MTVGPDAPPPPSASPGALAARSSADPALPSHRPADPGGPVLPARRPVSLLRSIRLRIALAFVFALLAMAGAQAYLIAQQGPVAESLRLVTEGYLPLAKQVALIRRDQDRVQRDLNRLSRDKPRPVTGETSATEIYTEELRANLQIARVYVQDMRAMPLDASEQAVLAKSLVYLDTIEQLFVTYEAQSRELLATADDGRLDEALENLRRPLRNTSKQLAEEVDKLDATINHRITSLAVASEQMQARARNVAVSLATFAFLIGGGLLLVAFYALGPIGQLTAQVQRVAAGGAGARVEVGGSDEVAVLATEFNAMAQAIEQRDRSLKERAEQLNRLSRYLASVVDSLEDCLVVVEQGVVTLTNPAAARLWAVEVDREPPDDLLPVLAPGSHDLAGPAGTVFAVRGVPFGDQGVVLVLTDVTDAVRAQERLARSERLALVGQMLAQITHEVRNPLNALSLNAELLADELDQLHAPAGHEAWEVLAMISGEVERLTDLTGHYLQLARRPPTRPAPTDLQRIVDDVSRLVEPELEALGATLQRVQEPLPRMLLDDNQLRQALLNVLHNALEAGARTLRLEVGRVGDELHVALHDDGPGMSADEVRHATDPFWSTKASGTGLGLAITRQILEDHDGRVEVDSVPGEGTTVTLVLPWLPAPERVDDLHDDPTVA